jgi:hypothetical protein
MSLELTLFWEFLKLFVKTRLAVSFAGKKIVFFGSTNQKLWSLKFRGEVWAGRACAGANQQELTTSAQKGGQ